MRDALVRSATLPRPVPGEPPLPRVPRPERWLLTNGLRVVAVPRPGLPQVVARLLFPAGSAADPAEFPGTAALVGGLLTEGTHSLSADELNARLDAMGASFSVQVGHDFTEIDLYLLSETLHEGVALLSELVRYPAFPADQVERARAETLDALDARLDEPANVADDRLAGELFGPDHPYGRLTTGTAEGVEAVEVGVLAEFHAAHYRPDGAVLLIAGAFDPGALAGLLEAGFGGWQGRVVAPVVPPPALRRPGRRIYERWEDAAQGELRIGGLGLARDSEDWIPAAVANYLLGGSTITGRLGANLREDKGWTYGVRSGFAAAVQPGGWVVETAVDAEVIAAAEREVIGELERFVSEPVRGEELQRAKDALILSLPRAFETAGRIIGRLATVEAFELPTDYWERFPERVQAVGPAEVREMAERYFAPDRLLRVIVGPGE